MFAKELLLVCVLLILSKDALGADCSDQACLRRLYNSKVIKAEKYTRPLAFSSSGGSSGGWWKRRKRSGLRKNLPHYNYRLIHAGVVVTLERSVEGNDRWLIHKGKDYGDRYDSVITDANYMLSGWTREDYKYISSCNKYVIDFMKEALIFTPYNLIGANCQTATNSMWDMVQNC